MVSGRGPCWARAEGELGRQGGLAVGRVKRVEVCSNVLTPSSDDLSSFRRLSRTGLPVVAPGLRPISVRSRVRAPDNLAAVRPTNKPVG